MKHILYILCFLSVLPLSLHCQEKNLLTDSSRSLLSIVNQDDSLRTSTKLERIAYVIGGSLAFSLFDYIGFNLTEGNKTTRAGFRIIQVTSQVAISYFLYKKFGLTSAISFNLIWWTWGDDLGFYAWTNLLNPARPWVNRTNNGLIGNQVTWAGWTPIGLLRRQGTVVDKYALFAQSLIGFSISIAIL